MNPSTRSWYASLLGAFLLLVLLAVVGLSTVPDILNGRSTALAATIAAIALLIVAAIIVIALIALLELALITTTARWCRWRARKRAEKRRGYLIGGPWS